jgi:hypothetical protein
VPLAQFRMQLPNQGNAMTQEAVCVWGSQSVWCKSIAGFKTAHDNNNFHKSFDILFDCFLLMLRRGIL